MINFKDMSPDTWGYDDLMLAVEEGIINGYPDGTFKPDRELTRQEMAVICGRLLKAIAKKANEVNGDDEDY